MITYLHRWFSKPLARHLRKPEGIFGRLTARMMNSTNTVMTATAIDLLNITPNDHVLDIGFGGGDSLGQLLHKAHNGHVTGLEMSAAMLKSAAKQYRNAISRDHLSLKEGAIEELPFEAAQFDRICTLNTIYFWQDIEKATAELYRVCKPGGKIVIAYRPRSVMQDMKFSQYGFNLDQADKLAHLLRDVGFQHIADHDHESDDLGFICLEAIK